MSWTYRLGRVAGTEIKVHATFLLLIGFWAIEAYARGGPALALGAVVLLLAVFACVLLHEFGHILMARRFGVQTPDVILLPIGGLARLERMPEEPRQELAIALAGPAVTLAIAVVLFAGLAATGRTPDPASVELDGSWAAQLLYINVLLLLFNLIPAFPMDGGRVLRALLAARIGLARATRVAAQLGQILAFIIGTYGLLRGNFILVLIAVFVFLGAGAEATSVATRAVAHGVTVTQMMVTRFSTLPVWASLADAEELLLSVEQRDFPVVDNLGRVEGLLTRDDLVKGLARRGPHAPVSGTMTAAPPAVPPDLGFDDALARLRASGLPALPVVDETGRLVGLLTRENVADLLLVRSARRA